MAKPKSAKAKPAKPRKLRSKAALPDPIQPRGGILMMPQRTGGVRVTEETALTLGAVWACVRVISESLAGLPWNVCRNRSDGGTDLLLDHPSTWLLDTQANPEIPAFQFRETIVAHALTWGNGYAEIERDAAGRPAWLWGITPDRVQPKRDDAGRIVYRVKNPTGPDTILDANDMYHLRGPGFDGLAGYSVIRMFARSIGTGIALEESAGNLFANDSTPGGFLKHPTRLSPEATTKLRESWNRMHSGPYSKRRVAVLEENMTWEQTGLPPEDMQMLEQRQFTPVEICRIFRVPPHKIADLTRATFSNIEHQSIEFVNDTLRPWAERQESEANIKLFGRTNRGTLQSVIDLGELKRGDSMAQANYVKEMMGWGLFSVNDGLRYLNRNPIGPDGDKRFVPLNYQLLEKAGEEPPPPKLPPAPKPGEPPADGKAEGDAKGKPAGDGLTARLETACWPLLEQACGRVLQREENRARTVTAEDWPVWCEKERDRQREYGTEVLTPPAQMLAEIYTPHSDAAAVVAVGLLLDERQAAVASGYPLAKCEPAALARRLANCVKAAAAAGGEHVGD